MVAKLVVSRSSILWELNSIFMQTISIVSDHKHGHHENHLITDLNDWQNWFDTNRSVQ